MKQKKANKTSWYVLGLFIISGLAFYFLTLKKDRIPASQFIPENAEVISKINPTCVGISFKDLLQNRNFFEQSDLPTTQWPSFFNAAGINFLSGAYIYKRGEQVTAVIEITDSIQLTEAWEKYHIQDSLTQEQLFSAWNQHCIFLSNSEHIKTDTSRNFKYDWSNPKEYLVQGFETQGKTHFALKVNKNNLEFNYSDTYQNLGKIEAEKDIEQPFYLNYHKSANLDSLLSLNSNPFSLINLSNFKDINQLSIQLNGFTKQEETFVTYEYDDNFELTEVKTVKTDTVPNLLLNILLSQSNKGLSNLLEKSYPFGKYFVTNQDSIIYGSVFKDSLVTLETKSYNELKVNADEFILVVNKQFNFPIRQDFQVVKEISGKSSEAPFSDGQLRITFKNKEQPLLLYLVQVSQLQ